MVKNLIACRMDIWEALFFPVSLLIYSIVTMKSNTSSFAACNCHGHAENCYYDPEIEQRKESLNLYGWYQGGGVCTDCRVKNFDYRLQIDLSYNLLLNW